MKCRPSTGKGRGSRRTTRRRSPSCSPASSSAPTVKHPFRQPGDAAPQERHVQKVRFLFLLPLYTSGYGACSRHTIYEMTLTELVLSEIRAHAEALELDEAAMLDRLQAQRTAADAERQESVRQEIGKLRRRVYELEQMTAKLYEDKVCGSISAVSFAVLLEKTEQERRQRTTGGYASCGSQGV